MAKLSFFYGEMGSGKTLKLIRDTRRFSPKTIVIMKPIADTKNGKKLLSRNGEECLTNHLVSREDDLFELIKNEYPKVKHVFVDEAQFLSSEQIDQLLKIATLLNIEVRAYGLRLSFKLNDENFAGATRLLQISHSLHCLKSNCDFCHKNQAIFSCLFDKDGKVVKNPPTILISDGKKEVNAHAICADCYYKRIK